jgi:hypothetical protein
MPPPPMHVSSSPFGQWHDLACTRGLRSVFPSQSPSRSLEVARPVGHASALGRRFRDPKPIYGPLARRADHPFLVYADSPWRQRDIARRVGRGRLTGDPPSQGEKLQISNPIRPRLTPRERGGEQRDGKRGRLRGQRERQSERPKIKRL